MNDPSEGTQHVLVTGHSLGAAMAQPFHCRRKMRAVTFANPGINGPLFICSRPIANAVDFDQLRGGGYVIHHIGDIKDGDLYDIALYEEEQSSTEFPDGALPQPRSAWVQRQ